MKSEWISIEDGLPDKDEPVIVHCPSQNPDKPLIFLAWYTPHGVGWSGMPDYWLNGIRHWMPLPEPPKENE